ncbi:MAG: oligoendopeptidase [Deltaproteobacteria bacterium]|nr:MAG: oligoendopeptidase [Deltaproteobacteria bacterium]
MNWDLASYFPGIGDEAYRTYVEALERDVESLRAAVSVEHRAGEAGATVACLAEQLIRLEDLGSRLRHAGSYTGCLVASDVRDAAAQAARARLAAVSSGLEKVDAAVSVRVAALPEGALGELRERLEGAEGAVLRMRDVGARRMDAEREALAADLLRDGMHAWGRLYQRLSGGLAFPLRRPDGPEESVPMSQRRTLMEDEDPAIRRAAFEGGNEAWAAQATVFAAALNAITGSRLTLVRERGFGHVLDLACHDSRITRRTLDAMMEAVEEGGALARRYLALKAKASGREHLGFFEFTSPLPGAANARVSWEQARERVCAALGQAMPSLGEYAEMAFERRWIEAEPRAGKSPGGFCTSSPVSGESRIFMTFRGTAGDVQTLAHELGHAYHNHVMRDLRPLARRYPMTLAESASTFAEQAYTEQVLEDASTPEAERLAVLNTRLGKAAAFLLDIPVRYRFELALHEAREGGELGVDELGDLMEREQRAVFGDILGPDGVDRWFWASKLHYFITGVSFYNFPYTFGYLFSMSLWERFAGTGRAGEEGFIAFLRATGGRTVEDVVSGQLGVDLGEVAFWRGCLAPVRRDLEALERLLG